MAPETRSQVRRTRNMAKAIQDKHNKFKQFMNGSFITFKRRPSQKRRKSRQMILDDENDELDAEMDSDDEMEERAAECYRNWSRREQKYYRDHEHHSLFWHMVLDWGLDPEHADSYFG
jgi:hypothetical protein